MPEMLRSAFADFGPLDWLLWSAGLGALSLFLLPCVASACGFTVVRFRCKHDPDAVLPDGSDPEYQEKFQELAALGFRPCGVVMERVWFFMYHLCKSTPVRKMVSPDGRTFVALYRLGGWGVTLRVAFSSLTEKKVFVQTATPGVGLAERGPDYHRTEVPEGTLAEVYERHLAEVGSVAAEGGEAVAAPLAELAAIDERRSARTLRRIGLGDAAWYPLVGWAVPFLACWVGFWALSSLPWSQQVGWSMAAAGCCYLFFIVKVVPGFLRLCERLPCVSGDDEGEGGPGTCAEEERAARD